MHTDNETGAALLARMRFLLWHRAQTELSSKEAKSYMGEAVAILAGHQELDAEFCDRYITRHTEEWELIQGLSVLALLGWQRPFDHRPLLDLLKRDDEGHSWKHDAIVNITRIAYHVQENELVALLDSLPNEKLQLDATCCLIRALHHVPDRAKAGRLLRRCLRDAATYNVEDRVSLLDDLVGYVEGNEDIFEAALSQTQIPHETVILAVSLLRETLPDDSSLRKRAEEASKHSQLAAEYFKLYLEMFITRKKLDRY